MYYLSLTKIQNNLINVYDREQNQGFLERHMSNYRNGLFSEAIYYVIPTMFKVKALKIPYGICPPKRWPFLSMLTREEGQQQS